MIIRAGFGGKELLKGCDSLLQRENRRKLFGVF